MKGNSESIKVKSAMMTQDIFPGAYLEPEWSRADILKEAAYYAVRLFTGAQVTDSPRGQPNIVGLQFEGTEYVLTKSNFRIVSKLANIILTDFWNAKNLGHRNFTPDIVLQMHRFAVKRLNAMLDVPDELAKVLWIQPDLGASGDFRSMKPYKYMRDHCSDLFYTERLEFANMETLAWYDALVMHRSPPPPLLATYQHLKSCGKTLVYELDDDLFNVPDWNYHKKSYDANAMHRIKLAINMADVIICSTEPLIQVCGRPEISFHGPNLVELEQYRSPLKCDRKIQKEYIGYRSVTDGNEIQFKCAGKKRLSIKELQESHNPVRILWTGSNTHDEDLKQIIPAVLSIGKSYGIAVRFYFMGYCPPELIVAIAREGNTGFDYDIKEQYKDFITFVPPVHYTDYIQTIKDIDPDISLCPLADHPFNISKSNLKVIEMGALGVPSIASQYHPYENTIEDGRDGVLVPVGNIKEWEKRIIELTENVELRTFMGSTIRNKVIRQYSWGSNGEEMNKWNSIFSAIRNKVLSNRKTQHEFPNAERLRS